MNLGSIKLLKSLPSVTNKNLISKNIIHDFYSSLKKALQSWEKNYEEQALHMEIQYSSKDKYFDINGYSEIIHNIRSSIEKNGCYWIKFHITINNNNYVVQLCLPVKKGNKVFLIKNIQPFFFNCLFKIYLWLFIVQPHIKPQCGNILNINIIFSNEKKKLLIRETLDTIHANSAFTTSCKKEASICVYRLEEWFKVFIHETFHCLGMDFSHMNNDIAESMVFKLFQVENINGRTNNRILEDVFESLICSIYNDLGFNHAEKFILNLITKYIDFDNLLEDDNYKDILLRFCQNKFRVTPEYEIIEQTGPPHNRTFKIICIIQNNRYKYGIGKNKKIAEQISAYETLKHFKQLS